MHSLSECLPLAPRTNERLAMNAPILSSKTSNDIDTADSLALTGAETHTGITSHRNNDGIPPMYQEEDFILASPQMLQREYSRRTTTTNSYVHVVVMITTVTNMVQCHIRDELLHETQPKNPIW